MTMYCYEPQSGQFLPEVKNVKINKMAAIPILKPSQKLFTLIRMCSKESYKGQQWSFACFNKNQDGPEFKAAADKGIAFWLKTGMRAVLGVFTHNLRPNVFPAFFNMAVFPYMDILLNMADEKQSN